MGVERSPAVLNGTVLRIGPAALPVPRETLTARPALARYAGRKIALGIRPEALGETGRQNGDDGGRLRGIVRAVEALGPEQLAHVEVQAKPVLVEDVLEGLVDQTEAEELAEILPDDTIDLAVDLRKLHFFDLDSGEAIVA